MFWLHSTILLQFADTGDIEKVKPMRFGHSYHPMQTSLQIFNPMETLGCKMKRNRPWHNSWDVSCMEYFAQKMVNIFSVMLIIAATMFTIYPIGLAQVCVGTWDSKCKAVYWRIYANKSMCKHKEKRGKATGFEENNRDSWVIYSPVKYSIYQ